MDITKEEKRGKEGKLWRHRETVKFEHDIASKESGTLDCRLIIDPAHRHYWMIRCKIYDIPYKFKKNNAEAPLHRIDKQSTPTFTFRGDSRNNFSVHMQFNSGSALFKMIPEAEAQAEDSYQPEDSETLHENFVGYTERI